MQSEAKCWRCIVTEPRAYVNRSEGISQWHTSPEAVQAYTYVPADSPIPGPDGQEGLEDNAIAHIKLFTADSNWTWYLTEVDRETGEAFGYVVGPEAELGYIDLNELSVLRGRMGLPVERDLYFAPTKIGALREVHER